MTDKLQLYFQYPFVRYALIVGILFVWGGMEAINIRMNIQRIRPQS